MMDSWWDESGSWQGLHALFDPVRIPFFRAALDARFGDKKSVRILDLGSGAGFVAAGLADVGEWIALDVSFQPGGYARVVRPVDRDEDCRCLAQVRQVKRSKVDSF